MEEPPGAFSGLGFSYARGVLEWFCDQAELPGEESSMTKEDIANRLKKKCGLTQYAARAAVGAVVDALREAVRQGERVELRGFGIFTVRARAPKKGRNPKTGRAVDVPARKIVRFKPGMKLRQTLNP